MTNPSRKSQSLRARLLPAFALAAFLFAQTANTAHDSQLDSHAAGQLCEFCLLFSNSHAALPATHPIDEGVKPVPVSTVADIDVLLQQTSSYLPQVRAPPVPTL